MRADLPNVGERTYYHKLSYRRKREKFMRWPHGAGPGLIIMHKLSLSILDLWKSLRVHSLGAGPGLIIMHKLFQIIPDL